MDGWGPSSTPTCPGNFEKRSLLSLDVRVTRRCWTAITCVWQRLGPSAPRGSARQCAVVSQTRTRHEPALSAGVSHVAPDSVSGPALSRTGSPPRDRSHGAILL